MTVSVSLMDGRTINLPVDSASTSKEISQVLSNKVKLKDTFGFSLYVALYEKVSNYIISFVYMIFDKWRIDLLSQIYHIVTLTKRSSLRLRVILAGSKVLYLFYGVFTPTWFCLIDSDSYVFHFDMIVWAGLNTATGRLSSGPILKLAVL